LDEYLVPPSIGYVISNFWRMAARIMQELNWEQFLVIGLLAVCVLGPICVVFLTQNLLDSSDDIGREHFEFSDAGSGFPDLSKTPASVKPAPPVGHDDRP
jgi:hypothetical protein